VPRGSRRKDMHRIGSAVILIAACVVILGTGSVYFLASRSQTPASPSASAALQDVRVTRGDFVQKLDTSGTLEGTPLPMPVTAARSGVLTWVPAIGTTVTIGQPLFRVDDTPVLLLEGSTPLWRAFSLGMTRGPDVVELESSLLALGFGKQFGLVADGNYTAADAKAVATFARVDGLNLLQGSLPVGSVLFEPGPIVVTGDAAPLGVAVSPGTSVLQANGTTRQVVSQIDASQTSGIHVGTSATVTLANGDAPVRASVLSVSSSPSATSGNGTPPAPSSGQSPGNGQTYITLGLSSQPQALLTEGSTVAVELQLAVLHDVYTVPVTALVAVVGGGYALQVDDGLARSHLIAVSVGDIDSVDDVAQVTGPHLAAGLVIEAPAG
jgi:hypothetical protein